MLSRRQALSLLVGSSVLGGDPVSMLGDLSSLFGAPPAGSAQDVRYRQGVILTFDPVTLSNTVEVGGAVLTDLPLLGVSDATQLVPGAVVGLVSIGERGKGQTLAILGRLVKPNTADAANAINLLSAKTQATFDTSNTSTTSATYVDLGGPSVSGVVGPSGRVLIFTGALITGVGENDGAGALRDTAAMAVELSGTNNLAANDDWAYSKAFSFALAEVTVANIIGRDVAAHVFSGLAPGATTFRAMYHSHSSGLRTADFADRIVIAMFL